MESVSMVIQMMIKTKARMNEINPDISLEHGVGFSKANRSETRKLGLLLSSKSSEAERE
jgi:hypothetical protein